MSREERRQYQRMMRNMEREPGLPPGARARAERNAARRRRKGQKEAAPPGSFTRGFVVRSVLVAVLVGFVAFSLQWPEMPFALYVGLIVTGVILLILAGFRLLQRRAANRA